MTYKLDKTREFLPINFAILTISDTRTKETDKSGDLLEKFIKTSGHMIVKRQIVPDDQGLISRILVDWSSQEEIEAIISTGGTGLTGRDVSVEAHRAVYDKEIDAFSTLFTEISVNKIGTSAVQSRACGGITNGTFLFALPGSPSACKDGWNEILVKQFDYRHMPCNFVELLPRLLENDRRK
ncbi:MAG: molybdenum cofactor biosynthesis protein [Rhodobacteraceae bacterium]|nr:molybdenum cofactor biosynthesis protein [Paracoccaceae bacterium]